MPAEASQRQERHEALRSIIEERGVGRQAELVQLLRRRGFEVTQASVSRDLRELEVAKIGGVYRFAADGAPERALPEAPWSSVRSVRPAGPHLLVVQTEIGSAARVGLAIDGAGWSEVVGTIAGDDTVFVATRGAREEARLARRLRALAVPEVHHG